jgi:hypothetical protein
MESMVSLDTLDRTRETPSEEIGQERFGLVYYKTIK